MNAIWVGTFVRGKDKKQRVVHIENLDWASAQFLIRVICDMQARDGWYLESYEMTGEYDGRATQAH